MASSTKALILPDDRVVVGVVATPPLPRVSDESREAKLYARDVNRTPGPGDLSPKATTRPFFPRSQTLTGRLVAGGSTAAVAQRNDIVTFSVSTVCHDVKPPGDIAEWNPATRSHISSSI